MAATREATLFYWNIKKAPYPITAIRYSRDAKQGVEFRMRSQIQCGR